MNGETADKAYEVACDLFDVTRDPEMALPVMRKCAEGSSIRAQAWLEGYWSHALLGCESVYRMAQRAISENDRFCCGYVLKGVKPGSWIKKLDSIQLRNNDVKIWANEWVTSP